MAWSKDNRKKMTPRLLRTTLALFFLGLFGVLEAATISCKNEEGEAVDWFAFYKLPKRQNKDSEQTGLEYLYLDSTLRSWKRSEQLINTTKSALGRTLQQLYEAYASKSNNTAYLIYNDGDPTSVNYSRKHGHAKAISNHHFYSTLTVVVKTWGEKDGGSLPTDTLMCGIYTRRLGFQQNSMLISAEGNTKVNRALLGNRTFDIFHLHIGVLLWNRIQGFWLIHSIPRFPPIPEEGYDYPATGRRNGQSGICITFKYSQYEAIDSQLSVCNPNVYSCSIPATFHQELVHMPKLCARSSSAKLPGRLLATLQSVQGQNFLHFAKSDSFLDDIFAAWMAQQLKTHLLTETWQRKRQELPSNCSLPYHVYNIKVIKIARQSYFNSYQDHAKWCVSQKGTKNRWTCIGDLNRSPHQAFRSGGFICTQNWQIYQAFQRLVLNYEDCN